MTPVKTGPLPKHTGETIRTKRFKPLLHVNGNNPYMGITRGSPEVPAPPNAVPVSSGQFRLAWKIPALYLPEDK